MDVLVRLFLCISGFIVLLLGVILHFKPATILTISTISFSGASVCLAIGFTSEIVSLLTNYWQNSVFKIFVSFLGAIAATLSLVVARLLINSFTRVDPSHFPITVSIFTTLFTPFVWWGLSIGLLFLLYIVLIIATPFWWLAFACFNSFFAMRNSYIYRLFLQKRKVPHSDLSFWKSMDKLIGWFGGVAGTLALAIALTFSLPDASINYTNQITRSLAKLLVYSNYQPISDECKNYNQGEWVASLGDISSSRKISVAVPDDSNGYTFQVRSCN